MRTLFTGLTTAATIAAATLVPVLGLQSASGAPKPAPDRATVLAAARADAGRVGRTLGLSSAERLSVKDVIRDADGSVHVRYTRTFRGLRVIGGDLVTHETPAGAMRNVTWNASGKVSVTSTTPALSAAAASGRVAKRSLRSATAPRTELVVWAGGRTPVLAYDVVTEGVKADQTPTRLHTLVDARSGRTLRSWDDIQEGTGNGIFVGSVPIATSGTTGAFTMKDTHNNVATDLLNTTSGTGTVFTDADDTWGNSLNSDRASAGVDAHYGAGKTYDFYNTVLGRAGIYNNGTGVPSRVHYGSNYVNAFWDGTQMTYGDGSGNAAPLTELDVAGHEMSHGVTENTAGLVYSGESGGLNEATSDIFGTAVEFYANNPTDVGDYLIGEKINIFGNGTPLRYMDQPSKDGSSKDCYSSAVGGLDPHYSSGPLNHWFYLASEGSGAKVINGVSYNSPTCDASTVTAVGRDKAQKIWYRTLSTYLTPNSTYLDARNGAIKSAKDLYPTDPTVCANIAASFTAIAVPVGTETCGPAGPTNLLLNPGFESGISSWASSAGTITNSTARPARTGSYMMWAGGNGTTTTESAQQTVTLPATAQTLKFWIRMDTNELPLGAYDTLKVQVISNLTGTPVTTTLATYSNLNASSTPAYVQKSFSLASYAGKTVMIRFLMQENSARQTSFVVDDTSIAP